MDTTTPSFSDGTTHLDRRLRPKSSASWAILCMACLGCGEGELVRSTPQDLRPDTALASNDLAQPESGVPDAQTLDLGAPDVPPFDAPGDMPLPPEDLTGPVSDTDSRVPDMTPPDDGPPPLVFEEVRWLHTDVSAWAETAVLASVTFPDGQICLDHDHADAWPHGEISGVVVAANPWVFIWHENQWWGATWEWMRPDQTCKNRASVAGDHIKQSPFDAASNWRPTSGQVLYFMVSGLARSGMRNAQERSNPVRVVWP